MLSIEQLRALIARHTARALFRVLTEGELFLQGVDKELNRLENERG